MALNIRSFDDIEYHGVKILVFGQSGVGKTRLIPTLPTPIVFSTETGLLSIRKSGLKHFHQIDDIDDLEDSFRWLLDSKEAEQYESVALDGITDIAENIN